MTDAQTELAAQQQVDADRPNGCWLPDCSNDEYHARPEWSNSQLKCLAHDGARMFARRYITKEAPRVHKQAFDLGTVVHAALLEPLGLLDIAAEIPPEVLSSNGSRAGAAWKEWAAQRPGKILLKAAELRGAGVMVDRVLGHSEALRVLRTLRGKSEQSVAWHDAESGLDLRCRFDRIAWSTDGRVVLLDVKTTRDVSLPGFAKQVAQLGYHNQAAHYWDGAVALGENPVEWLIPAVQNSEPYDCIVYRLDPRAIEQGRRENRAARLDLARRLETGNWEPDTYGKVVDLDLPEYGQTVEPVTLTVGGERVDL